MPPDPLHPHDLIQVRPFAHEVLGGRILTVIIASDEWVQVPWGLCVATVRRADVALVGRARWTMDGDEVAASR